MMIIVFSQPCTKSNNNNPCLYSEKAFQSVVLRLREEMRFVDAGLGTARISMQDEPTGVPINRAASFENKVGAMDLVAGESLIKKKILNRFFMDLVAGESLIKERASARFNDLVGSTDVVAGEPLLLIPRRFRQKRAWMELNKIWRTNRKVKGLFFEKVKRGYSVAIAGFITFLPFRPRRKRKIGNPRFPIKSIKPKKKKILVFIHGGIKNRGKDKGRPMPTLNQLIRQGREEKRRTALTRTSDQCPQKQGVRPRVPTYLLRVFLSLLGSSVACFFGRFLEADGSQMTGNFLILFTIVLFCCIFSFRFTYLLFKVKYPFGLFYIIFILSCFLEFLYW